MPDEEKKVIPSSMSKYLRPDRFDIEPSIPGSDNKWAHWKYSFENFIALEANSADEDLKFKILANHISPSIFNYICECTKYKDAIATLNATYERKQNIILARHRLISRRQQPGESMAEYSRALTILARDCVFKDVTAKVHQDEAVRGAFIAGVSSSKIRERLLEKSSSTLEETLNLAISLETAGNTSQLLTEPGPSTLSATVNAAVPEAHNLAISSTRQNSTHPSQSTQNKRRCFFCGGPVHQRLKCPARNADCQLCSKKGHFANVCRSSSGQTQRAANVIITQDDDSQSELTDPQLLTILAAAPASLRKTTVKINLNNIRADALLDSGSSITFINNNLARSMDLKRKPSRRAVALASSNNISYTEGHCYATIEIGNHKYERHPLHILAGLCADVIIGQDILEQHKSVEVEYGGKRESLKEPSEPLQPELPELRRSARERRPPGYLQDYVVS
ncbi:gag-polyprotein putative aspartyl protease domain-containing protein [Phthorimaea operculella]|nr:gag-polyprotein putative aspartyl protease domain-containing protein [Phthorimaea operculella]